MKRRGLPKWCSEFQDRHGKWRVRARRKGFPPHYFKASPGTDEFAVEYRRWLAGEKHEIGASRTKPGTISALIVKFYGSAKYLQWAESTKVINRGVIERFRAEHGDKRVAMIERKHVRSMIEKKMAAPNAANHLLVMLRALMEFAIDQEWRRDDPTAGIKRLTVKSGGFVTWSEEDIATFEAKHAVGTRARLALALLLYTGQRRGDVIRMGRQHVRDHRLHVTQEKTGVRLAIPMHPELIATLAATPADNLTFISNRSGKPFEAKSFTMWFGRCCAEAGLSGLSAHGLRKACARRLAEAGCSVHEIASITGHKTLKEVQRYTEAVDQERTATAAINRQTSANQEQKLSNPSTG